MVGQPALSSVGLAEKWVQWWKVEQVGQVEQVEQVGPVRPVGLAAQVW